MHETLPHGGTLTVPQVVLEADEPVADHAPPTAPRASFPGTSSNNDQVETPSVEVEAPPTTARPGRGRFSRVGQMVGRRVRAVPRVGSGANTRFKVAVLLSFVALVSALVANKMRQDKSPPDLQVAGGSGQAGADDKGKLAAADPDRTPSGKRTRERPASGAMPASPTTNPPNPVAGLPPAHDEAIEPTSTRELPPIPRDAVVPTAGSAILSQEGGSLPVPETSPAQEDGLPQPLADAPPEPVGLVEPTAQAPPDSGDLAAPGLLSPPSGFADGVVGGTSEPTTAEAPPATEVNPPAGQAEVVDATEPPAGTAEPSTSGVSALPIGAAAAPTGRPAPPSPPSNSPGDLASPIIPPNPGAARPDPFAAEAATPTDDTSYAQPGAAAPAGGLELSPPTDAPIDSPASSFEAGSIPPATSRLAAESQQAPATHEPNGVEPPTTPPPPGNAMAASTDHAISARLEPNQLHFDPVPDPARATAPPSDHASAEAGAAAAGDVEVIGGRIEPISHVVRRGENFYTISRYYYGSGRYWRALWAANREQVPRYNELYVGTSLQVPAPEDLDRGLIDPPASASASAPSGRRGSDSNAETADEPPTADAARRDLSAARTALTSGRSRTAIPSEGVDLDLPTAPVRSASTPGDAGLAGEARPDPRTAASRTHARAYTVRGDYETFRTIARDQLRDSTLDGELSRLNADRVSDPDGYIPRGTRLRLPEPLAPR